uniref:Uncharacterized protein n=1 Tax=Amphimedon queenslandica TaxID=400682 RepID=A0A1X7UT48_AMPQE
MAVVEVYNWIKHQSRQFIVKRGCPQIHIDENQLSLLLSFGFSSVDIPNMLKVA